MTLLQIRGSVAAFVPISAQRGVRVGRVARLRSPFKRWIARDGHPSELLRLNDHVLTDMGMSRAELEVAALFWPLTPRPRPPSR